MRDPGIQVSGSLRHFVVSEAQAAAVPVTASRRMLFQIFLVRRFEEKLLELKDQELIHGPVHSSIGQEASAVGCMHALAAGDLITSTHRGHHHFLCKTINAHAGIDFDPLDAIPAVVFDIVRRTAAEIMGLGEGYCRGRGGSMHLADRDSRCLGTNAIVAGGVPCATGAAWAEKLKRRQHCAVAFMGDGALGQGVVHEVMNMAAVFAVPVIYFIENNLYAVATHVAEAFAVEHLAQHGLAHGIDGLVVDGMNPLAVYAAVQCARELALQGPRPVIVEAKTYRFRHQAQGLPGSAFGYRTKDEEEQWALRDPVSRFPIDLIDGGMLTPAERDRLWQLAGEVVESAVKPLPEHARSHPVVENGSEIRELYAGVLSAESPCPAGGDAAPSDPAPHDPTSAARTFIEAIPAVMGRRLETDETAILLGEEVGHLRGGAFLASKGLRVRFPDRVFDTPISEAGFSGMALGLALNGMRPIVEIMYPDFALVAADQLFNQISRCRYMYGDQFDVPLVVRTRVGIGSGYGAQHSMEPSGLYASFPGWRIVAPSTPADYVGLFNAAFRSNDPVLVIEHQALYPTSGPLPSDLDYCIPFGKARIVSEGRDVTLLASSWMTIGARKAAEVLAEEGIAVEVIDLRSLDYGSIDYETIGESLRKTGYIVIAEEGTLYGGIGAHIAWEIQNRFFDCLDGEIRRVATAPVPMPVGRRLERLAVPQVDDICRVIRELIA